MAFSLNMRKISIIALSLFAVFTAGQLILEVIRLKQTAHYNTAIEQSQFEKAKPYQGDYGLFANAYAQQHQGNFQRALIGYISLEESSHEVLKNDVLFNMGNTYLQQAMKLDIEKDAEQAFPLLELAKVSYRKVLRMDNQYWGAKYNLERALQLLPDAVDAEIITQEGYVRLVKAVISAANEDELP